jgi:hypothetical protein
MKAIINGINCENYRTNFAVFMKSNFGSLSKVEE